MGLMTGSGPFGRQPAGVFNFTREGPAHVLYLEQVAKRVRGEIAGVTVVDSRRVQLLHETGLLPVWYFPREDVCADLLVDSGTSTHCPFKGDARYWHVRAGGRLVEDALWTYERPLAHAPPLAGYVAAYFDRFDAWYEEDERVGVHPRDPYHRVDARRSSRHVRVVVDDEVLAESTRPTVLFETGLPPRFYLPSDDVRVDRLRPSPTRVRCPYKGEGHWWSLTDAGARGEDVAWTFDAPLAEGEAVRGLHAFDSRKVDVVVDGDRV